MINIRKEISKLFDQFSHDVVYVRRDVRFRCECYSERSGESIANCEKCFGTGNVVTIEKIRARRNISSVPESLVGVNRLNQAGRLAPKAYIYYLEHDANPREDDLVLEVIWDAKGVPRYIKEKNLISAVDAKQGYKGRIEFYQTYCRYDQKGDLDDQALSKH